MFKARILELQKELTKQKLDAVLITDVFNITYLTDFANFSREEREAYLIITKNQQYIITDGRYTEAVKKEVIDFILVDRNKLEDFLKRLNKQINILGIEENNLTVAEHKLFKKHFKKLKHVPLETHRSIKSQDEIKKIEEACNLGDLAFEYILKKIKNGISEKELAVELEFYIKKNGAEFSFPPIVAFGENSAIPHHKTSDKRLTINDKLVLLDFGVKIDSYCSDMTRTVFLGKPSSKQKKIYQTVLQAQQKAVDYITQQIKVGKQIKASAVDKAARDYIISQGYPSIPHSLGHGIGLEVHEDLRLSSKSKDTLKEGMVFSIEPGIYLKDWGGVRIEDLFILEKGKLRQITLSPVQPKII